MEGVQLLFFYRPLVEHDSSGITTGITGHERKTNHFAPARLSAPRASPCYAAIRIRVTEAFAIELNCITTFILCRFREILADSVCSE